MYTIENKVGRLIEIRFWSPILAEEPNAWQRDYRRMIGRMRNGYVLFIDFAELLVFPMNLFAAFALTMGNETRPLRIAIVSGANPTFDLQMQQMVRNLGLPNCHRPSKIAQL